MQEFSTVSASSFDPAALAAKLTEKSAEGWTIVSIVPTGGDVTAFLSRAAGESAAAQPEAAPAAAQPEAATAAEPAGWAVAPEPAAAPMAPIVDPTPAPAYQPAPAPAYQPAPVPSYQPAGTAGDATGAG
ncbi:MAG: dihydrolipoamide succinyltransferase, partial [Actinomycetota bacterium]